MDLLYWESVRFLTLTSPQRLPAFTFSLYQPAIFARCSNTRHIPDVPVRVSHSTCYDIVSGPIRPCWSSLSLPCTYTWYTIICTAVAQHVYIVGIGSGFFRQECARTASGTFYL